MKKVMIACSTCFYDKIDEISKELIKLGFDIIYPNGYNEENEWRDDFNEEEYVKFFKKMFANSRDKTCKTDILLVLNFRIFINVFSKIKFNAFYFLFNI